MSLPAGPLYPVNFSSILPIRRLLLLCSEIHTAFYPRHHLPESADRIVALIAGWELDPHAVEITQFPAFAREQAVAILIRTDDIVAWFNVLKDIELDQVPK